MIDTRQYPKAIDLVAKAGINWWLHGPFVS